MNKYKTTEFIILKEKWYKTLKASNFNDLEDKYENLYNPDIRTIAWKNKDAIREFFLSLDSYLENEARIPHKHWIVLKNWSAGMYLIDIVKCTGIPSRTIDKIISKYKKFILNQ